MTDLLFSVVICPTVAILAAAVFSVAGCQGKPEAAHPGFPACVNLLHDARLAGFRLVEASSHGSGHVQCFYAPAKVRTAKASMSNPIPGKLAVLPESGGTADLRDTTFTQPPVDPGDAGRVSDR
jgi:hypothetical protein